MVVTKAITQCSCLMKWANFSALKHDFWLGAGKSYLQLASLVLFLQHAQPAVSAV